jgi:hypothetical protein
MDPAIFRAVKLNLKLLGFKKTGILNMPLKRSVAPSSEPNSKSEGSL